VALAARQRGRIARWQLLDLGMTPRGVDRRIERSWLLVVWAGVYALGHRERSRQAAWWDALLLGGPGAVLSCFAAAAHYEAIRWKPTSTHVIAPARRTNRHGIHFHRGVIPLDEVNVHHGMPVTSPPRTLFDMAAELPLPRGARRPPRQLESALNQMDALRLWDALSLDDLLARYPRRRGARAIRLALEWRRDAAAFTRSELEDGFLDLVDELMLRRPELNVWLDLGDGGPPIEVDALWRRERLAVEIDSHAFHMDPMAFERDRARDRRLTVQGWRPLRVTGAQLRRHRAELAHDLRRLVEGATLAA